MVIRFYIPGFCYGYLCILFSKKEYYFVSPTGWIQTLVLPEIQPSKPFKKQHSWLRAILSLFWQAITWIKESG